MVLLDVARQSARPPALAGWLLACGITATRAANILAGAAYDLLGAVVAVLMLIARAGAVTTTVPASVTVTPPVAADAESAAALASSMAAGSRLSQREIARRFGMPRSRAAVLAREVAAAGNGHG